VANGNWQLATMHELPFIILARRGDDDDGNQDETECCTNKGSSHVQGRCCGLDNELVNRGNRGNRGRDCG